MNERVHIIFSRLPISIKVRRTIIAYRTMVIANRILCCKIENNLSRVSPHEHFDGYKTIQHSQNYCFYGMSRLRHIPFLSPHFTQLLPTKSCRSRSNISHTEQISPAVDIKRRKVSLLDANTRHCNITRDQKICHDIRINKTT